MLYDAIDSVFLAAPNLDVACRPYELIGLRPTPPERGRRSFSIGGPDALFTVHFVSKDTPDSPLSKPLHRALEATRSLFAVGLRVADLNAVLDRLGALGVAATQRPADETQEAAAWLSSHDLAAADVVLVQSGRRSWESKAAAMQTGCPSNTFRLKRLDHLAAITHDLEAKTRFWVEVMGVPLAGEVTTPTMVIRQFRIGDAVLELLGPASAASPLWKRPLGLASMVSWEPANLEESVLAARAAGFAVPDPTAGVLPGTRTTTIPGADLAGVNMQLLQYV